MTSRTRWLVVGTVVAASLAGLAAVFHHGPAVPQMQAAASPSAPPSAMASTEHAVRLRGRVVGPNGDPVGGAHVRVLAQARVVAETETDPAGVFSFDGLASDRVRVEADHEPEGAVHSALVSVSTVTTELTLVLALASVRGMVVDADDGHPIPGAKLYVDGLPFAAHAATSDTAGAFRFAVVPFEATSIVAVASGYRAARVALGAREDQPEPTLRIALRAGSPVLGDVQGPDDKPVHAQVVACEGQPTETRVESGDDGTFQLPPSSVGCDAVAVHDEMAPSDPVPIVDGRRATLRLGAGGAIAGVAVDDRGTTVDSFSVGVESFVPIRGQSTPRRGPTAFKAGAFRLERLVPGSYVLTAWTKGRPPARSSAVVVRSGGVTDGVRIVLAQGGVVVGRVVDDQRAPLADAELRFDAVSAVIPSLDAVATTDASGSFRLDGAPSGLFTVRARKDGYRMKLVSGLLVASGQTVNKDLVLTPTAAGGPGLELGGIGTSLVPAGNGIALVGLGPGDPAALAGLKEGDRIVRIDGDDIAGLSLVDVIQRLRGEPGTVVGLTVDRAGSTLDVAITRAELVR